MSGFLPSLKPGNIRSLEPIDSDNFKISKNHVGYIRPTDYLDLNMTNPNAGTNDEFVSGLLKIYQPEFGGILDSPNAAVVAGSQLGHNNALRLHTLSSNDNGFVQIDWDDSPNSDFVIEPEVDVYRFYDFYKMDPSTERRDAKGVYRQARFRIIHTAGDTDARFTRMEFNHISAFTGTGYAPDTSSTRTSPYELGNPIIDLHINLTTAADDADLECTLGLGYHYPCALLEKLDVKNTPKRRIKGSNSVGSSLNHFFRGCHSLVDPGDAPYFQGGNASVHAAWMRCNSLLSLNDTWADPERRWIRSDCNTMSHHFWGCGNLVRLPENYFTCGLDSPNAVLESCTGYHEMFTRCYSLTHIPKIPMRRYNPSRNYKSVNSGTKMYRMFYDCINLERVPDGVHTGDLVINDSNGHNNAPYSGLSSVFRVNYHLSDLNEFRLDTIPHYNENSPNYPYRVSGNSLFTGVGSAMHKFPYIGSTMILGGTIADGGPETNGDVQQIFNGAKFREFDSPYLKHGINISTWSDIYYALGYASYNGPKDYKIRCIADNPLSKNLNEAVPTGQTHVGNANSEFMFRQFFGAYGTQSIEFVGFEYYSDNFVNSGHSEYGEMFRSNYHCKQILGMDFTKANEASDYSLMFTGCRELHRLSFTGDKVGTFDGSDDYIDTGFPSNTFRPASANTAYTMSAVVEIDTISSAQGGGRIIVAANGTSTRGGLEINSEGGTARAIFRIGGTAYRSDGGGTGATAVTINTGEKYHICATVDFTGTDTADIKLYVDGVLTKNAPGSSMGGAADATTVKIGANGTGASGFFDGKMYNIRLYDDILTADEVQKLSDHYLYLKYREGGNVTDQNLTLHYSFEDGHGTTVFNRAGASQNGGAHSLYNGTVNGATSAEFWANFDQRGFKYSFNMDYCPLTPTALREIFVNLPTVSSGTFSQTNNTDYTDLLSDEDKAIATDKGWTLSF